MPRTKHQNIERVIAVASQLEELVQEVVFVGGAAAELLVTDPAVGDIRATIDVDVIVEVTTLAKYYNFQERLRSKGFRESMEDGVICRWRSKEILLDVMLTDEQVLGFSNKWCIDAVRYAQFISVEGVALRNETDSQLGLPIALYARYGCEVVAENNGKFDETWWGRVKSSTAGSNQLIGPKTADHKRHQGCAEPAEDHIHARRHSSVCQDERGFHAHQQVHDYDHRRASC